MEKLTVKSAEKYINKNYGQPKHAVNLLVKSCKHIAKKEKLKPLDLFFLLIENKPIRGVTHSYGFHNSRGRNIIESLQSKYYQLKLELSEEDVLILN